MNELSSLKRTSYVTMGVLFLALFVAVFADVWLKTPAPYRFDPEGGLSYEEWLDQLKPMRWFWGLRPSWDVPVAVRGVWLLGAAILLAWRAPSRRLGSWLARRARRPLSPTAAAAATAATATTATPDAPDAPLRPSPPPPDTSAVVAVARPPGGRSVLARCLRPVVALLCVAAFLWTFRSQDLRHGDSHFLSDLIPREVASLGANIAYEEILDTTLHCRAYYHLNRLFDAEIQTVFHLTGIGAALIALALAWPRWRRLAGLPAGLILLLWYLTGWSHMFFGHLEYYTSVAAVLLVYAAVAIAHLEREDGPPLWLCAFLAGLAACFHMLAGWVWPTLALLFWHDVRRRGRPAGRLLLSGGAAFLFPIALSVAIASLYGFPPTRFSDTHIAHMKFIFLLTPENALETHRAIYQYPFLSFAHLRDIVNQWPRTAWPGVVLTLALLPFARRYALHRHPTVQFWLLTAILLQIFVMVWNPDLGYLRDWDLFGVVALGWTGLGIEWLRLLNRHAASDPGETAPSPPLPSAKDRTAPPPSPALSPNAPPEALAEVLGTVVVFVLVTGLPMRIFLMLHHSWWIVEPNRPGVF